MVTELAKSEESVERICSLVLGRVPGQTVHVGANVVVEVVSVYGNRVRLRFLAPESVKIVRGELLRAA